MLIIDEQIQEQFKALSKPERFKVVVPLIQYFNKSQRYINEVLAGKRPVDSNATLDSIKLKYKEVYTSLFDAA